jgi:hypothetical protein
MVNGLCDHIMGIAIALARLLAAALVAIMEEHLHRQGIQGGLQSDVHQ